MAELNVDIVTPERLIFSGTAREIRVPGALGEFGVLPQHTEFLSLAREGILTLVTASGEKKFEINGGFAEAGPDRVVVLADSARDLAAK
ncbi:MAG: ATP synthase F1 subunit epsilon [Myxococcota bacterium]